MVFTKEKIIPAKLDMNSEELDIIVDFKLLLERIERIMSGSNASRFGAISKEDIETLQEYTNTLYANVGVDYSADKVIRRVNDGTET